MNAIVSTRHARVWTWALVAVLPACDHPGLADGTDPAQVAGKQQELFTRTKDHIWPDGNAIPICFQPSEDLWDNQREDYDARKTVVRQWVEETYETIPNVGINITGWGECPNYADFVYGDEALDRIELLIDGGSGAQTAGNRRGIRSGLGTSRTALIHEIAHVLGFAHEHQRTDSTENPGTWDEIVGVGKRCVGGVVFDVLDDGSTGPRSCLPNKQRTDLSGVYLTSYDFWSITNATYCHCRAQLSEMDRLALEIAYPAQSSLNGVTPVRIDYGFQLGDESVIRALGFPGARLRLDWFERGALAPAFLDQGVRWKLFPFNNVGFLDTGAGYLPVLSTSYRAEWTDFMGRARTSAIAQIDASRATALAMSVLP